MSGLDKDRKRNQTIAFRMTPGRTAGIGGSY